MNTVKTTEFLHDGKRGKPFENRKQCFRLLLNFFYKKISAGKSFLTVELNGYLTVVIPETSDIQVTNKCSTRNLRHIVDFSRTKKSTTEMHLFSLICFVNGKKFRAKEINSDIKNIHFEDGIQKVWNCG